MHLKSLEISGFKSFARKGELLFKSPITAIVGPNGSGKSNVAEAFRFVLGEQSMKSMRGKRGEDMIWNGSGELARQNRAAVKLIFDNTARLFPLEFDEISIERVVNRDSSNEYFINGSNVRLRDVLELLSKAHIGATGHHIISQGEADRVLRASPTERKDILSEALGLTAYEFKKEESIRKLERTEENMKEVESLRKEIAPHLKFLKRQVEKIEKTEAMRIELREAYKTYLADEEYAIFFAKKELILAETPIRDSLKAVEERLKEVTKSLAGEHAVSKLEAKTKELDLKLHELRSRKDTRSREFGGLEGEERMTLRMIEREVAKAKEAAGVMIPFQAFDIFAKNIELRIREAGQTEDSKTLKEMLADIEMELKRFIKQYAREGALKDMEKFEADLAKLRLRKEEIQKELDGIGRDERALEVEREEHLASITEAKNASRVAERESYELLGRQHDLESRFHALQNEKQLLAHREARFSEELREASVLGGREAISYEKKSENTTVVSTDEQEKRRKDLERLKIRIEDSGVGVNASDVLKEYKETEERDAFLAKELTDLAQSQKTLEELIAELVTKIKEEFERGIKVINREFDAYFKMMFGGGSAVLKHVKEEKRKRRDEDDILADLGVVEEPEFKEGIDIDVSLPRKKIRGLDMLSGGERALTSIALLFAMSQVNPPPFIILDETDAALDEANSKKYGDMVANLAAKSQLIVITHNRETMSRAGVLYGVTMGKDGASRLLSIEFEEAVRVAK